MKKIGLTLMTVGILLSSSCKKDEGLNDGDHKEKFLKSYSTLASGVDFKQTSDGGYILLGTTKGALGNDFLLVKTDAFGNAQWSKSYSGPVSGSNNQASALEIMSDGGYAILGTTTAPTFNADSSLIADLSSTYLILTDYLGNKKASKVFSSGIVDPFAENELANGLAYEDDGISECIYMVSARQTSANTVQSMVRKYNINTQEVSELQTIGSVDWILNDIMVYSDQELYAVGYSTLLVDSTSGKNILGLRIYNDKVNGVLTQGGDLISGLEGDDEVYTMTESNDGGLLAAGYSTGSDGDRQLLLVKMQNLDSDPSVQWSFEGTGLGIGSEEARSVIEVSDGYIVAGYTEDVDRQFLIAKINSTGTSVLWEKDYGYVSFDEAKSVIQTNDNGLAVFGTSSDERGNPVMTMLKLDASGNLR